MFNIKWEKGSQESLEGKVIVYAKFNSNGNIDAIQKSQNPFGGMPGMDGMPGMGAGMSEPELYDGMIFALYGTIDKATYDAKFGFQQKEAKKQQEEALKEMFGGQLPEHMKSIMDGAKKMMEGITKMSESKGQQFYVSTMEVSGQDIFAGNEDVIFVGEYDHPQTCKSKVLSVMDLYRIELAEKMKTGSFKTTVARQSKSYRDFAGQPFVGYISSEFLGPIFDAYNRKEFNTENVRKMRKELGAFFKIGDVESPFSKGPLKDDVLDLENTLEACKQNNGVLLGQLYFKKVEAIVTKLAAVHEENYTLAHEVKTQLDLLNRKITEHSAKKAPQ